MSAFSLAIYSLTIYVQGLTDDANSSTIHILEKKQIATPKLPKIRWISAWHITPSVICFSLIKVDAMKKKVYLILFYDDTSFAYDSNYVYDMIVPLLQKFVIHQNVLKWPGFSHFFSYSNHQELINIFYKCWQSIKFIPYMVLPVWYDKSLPFLLNIIPKLYISQWGSFMYKGGIEKKNLILYFIIIINIQLVLML